MLTNSINKDSHLRGYYVNRGTPIVTENEFANIMVAFFVTTNWRLTLIRESRTHFHLGGQRSAMSEFEAEVKKAEKELEQGLMTVNEPVDGKAGQDEFLGDLKMQAQEYGQKIQDTASKAYDYASEKFTQAGDKIKDLSSKDPRELVEDAKEFARQKPGQTILISAAVGLVLGLILRGRK